MTRRRRLEGHGVLGEEVLALGSLGHDAGQGLEGESTNSEDGGEHDSQGEAEGGVATLLREQRERERERGRSWEKGKTVRQPEQKERG